MTSIALHDEPGAACGEQCATVAPQAVMVVVAGMVAAWLAAGSTGLLGTALQHGLTWFALAVAVVAAWPAESRSFGTWAILAGGATLGLLLDASALPMVNVFAVTVVLAAIAQVQRGLTSRAILVAAMATGTLGLFRFACDSIPIVWLVADAIGWTLGRIAGWLAGCRLEVGATFGGIDYLVLMAAIYAGWLVCTEPPRRRRAVWAAAAIALGHFVYLAALANSEKLLTALPDVFAPPATDINYVGVWTWSNGLRTLIPWNVPLLAVAIHGSIAAVMFRSGPWRPIVEPDPKALKKQKEKEEKEEIPGAVLAADMLFRFGPVLLAVAATLLAALALNTSDLKGKTIVAHEKGYLNWLKPEYESEIDGFYGMLPAFVESLGGKFVTSKDLLESDLAEADVLVLLHPDQPWPEKTLERIWAFVHRGGSLLVVADPAIRQADSLSSFNGVLQSEVRKLAMQVRFDTAVTRTGNWEQSYQPLAHPATVGIDGRRNRFGLELGSSIRTRWPARPVLAGKWGWSDPGSDAAGTGVSSHDAGELLGDLVLAAEQPVGAGRVFVLGGTSPLRNEMLANAYPFTGRLLGYLANRPPNPQDLWRQVSALAALAALATLVALRPAAWQMILTPTLMSLSLVCCTAAGHWAGRVLPDGRNRPGGFNNVAYIDASHLEAYSSDLWTDQGIAGLTRTLMCHGYLPLLAPELTPQRLQRAGLLISIAPAREFSPAERAAVGEFVAGGGTFICMVGAEEARPIAPLLADFSFTVPPSPVPPGEDGREPEPLGAFRQLFGQSGKRYVQFYAGWPLQCAAANPQRWIEWSDGTNDRPIVVGQSEQGGTVVAIADTHFAANENLETLDRTIPDNIRFWRWLLSRVVAGQKPWTPPPPTAAADASPADEEAVEDGDSEEEDRE